MRQDDRLGRTSIATEARVQTHLRRLTELFDRRPELTGVHPPADLAAEAVRWSV